MRMLNFWKSKMNQAPKGKNSLESTPSLFDRIA